VLWYCLVFSQTSLAGAVETLPGDIPSSHVATETVATATEQNRRSLPPAVNSHPAPVAGKSLSVVLLVYCVLWVYSSLRHLACLLQRHCLHSR